MRSFWYQNASSPSGNGFTKPPDHKTAFYSMRTGHFLALQALVFALVTAAFTNIYITQPAIVIFVSIMLFRCLSSAEFLKLKKKTRWKKNPFLSQAKPKSKK
jgi:hypothetical protein